MHIEEALRWMALEVATLDSCSAEVRCCIQQLRKVPNKHIQLVQPLLNSLQGSRQCISQGILDGRLRAGVWSKPQLRSVVIDAFSLHRLTTHGHNDRLSLKLTERAQITDCRVQRQP